MDDRTGAGHDALVLDLDQVDAGMLPIAGGKAANLGELIRAGMPVPPGFCVTTSAYRLGAETDGLRGIIEELERAPAGDVASLAELAERARKSILGAPVPAEVASAVAGAYAGLGADAPVAVRSSATAEDLPFASFAGQQDTYLNVVGGEAVLDAVRRCWASLWTDRAVAYRASNGIDHRTVRLAVAVQRMVDAGAAGVLFTANPVTGKRGQAVIDASPGLGEVVVSGAVNPDHFVIETAGEAGGGRIVERGLGDKRLLLRALPGGGTERVELAAGGEACVTDAQLLDLAALGRRVEAHYGAPQDTEWAIDAAGALWLTQARPITTLYPLPAGARPDGDDLRVYFCFTLAQGLTRPITPMGLAAMRLIASSVSRLFGSPVGDPVAGPRAFVDAGQRGFIDVTTVLRSRVGRSLAPRFLDVMEARSSAVLRQLATDPRLSVVRRSSGKFLRPALRLGVRFRIPMRVLEAAIRPDRAMAHAERAGERAARLLVLPEPSTAVPATAVPAAPATATATTMTATPATAPPAGSERAEPEAASAEVATPSASERLDAVERGLAGAFPLMPAILPAPVAGFALLGLAGKLVGASLEPGELEAVLRGLPHNVTTEMDLRLWALATRIRAEPGAAALLLSRSPGELAREFRSGTLPPAVRGGLDDFLRAYGHRAVAEIDLGLPRWSDDPTYVLGVIANYLRLDDPELAPDAQFARAAASAEAAVARLIAKARRRGRLRARVVGFALDRARRLAGLRELPKYYLVVMLAQARRQLAAVGDELAASGTLAAPDDVFFLDLPEVRAALRAEPPAPGLVAARREAYGLELRRRHVPRVMLSDGTEPEALAPRGAAGDGALSGTAASAGTVTGVARVVLDPVGAHLEPGEILVAPSTDPGWTPLFLTAGGLVMEMGGANSHGAVVAREYGIPAVVGVADATVRLETGQRITVDGAAGTVRPA